MNDDQPATTCGVAADYAGIQDYLFSLKARGIRFGIDRMRELSGYS